jgi:hypothetical protein
MALPTVTDLIGPVQASIDLAASVTARTPFYFTSDMRLANSGTDAATSTSLQDSALAFYDTSKATMIGMMVNPQAIKWTQAKRVTKQDTMTGSVFFHFTDPQFRDNDLIDMDFSGMTGNIDTRDPANATNQKRLAVWHQLYELSREQVVFLNANNQLIENKFHIIYQTQLFPYPIRLTGIFRKVLEFTEKADQPFNREYNFAFTVQATTPTIDDIAERTLKGNSPAPAQFTGTR